MSSVLHVDNWIKVVPLRQIRKSSISAGVFGVKEGKVQDERERSKYEVEDKEQIIHNAPTLKKKKKSYKYSRSKSVFAIFF